MAEGKEASRGKPFYSVRQERRGDAAARERLLDAAMGPGRKRKSSEKLRRGRIPAEGLALVAVSAEGSIVGTVRLWHVSAGSDRLGKAVPALLLGPLAVHSREQGMGIGSLLVREALTRASAFGHGAVILVGDPDYYGRFGFSSSSTGKLSMPGPYEMRRLLAAELRPGWLAEASGTLAPTGLPRTNVCLQAQRFLRPAA